MLLSQEVKWEMLEADVGHSHKKDAHHRDNDPHPPWKKAGICAEGVDTMKGHGWMLGRWPPWYLEPRE